MSIGSNVPPAVPRRVLLVEDNVIIAMSAEELLLEIGVEQVMIAHSVAEAASCCDPALPDFALLDFDLGEETSVDIARRLRDGQVPFVFASGFGDLLDLPEDLVGSKIMKKPYFLADLERVLHAGHRAA